MTKPSDFLDALDKAMDLANLEIDMRRQHIIDKIFWLERNFENINALRGYFLGSIRSKNPTVNQYFAKRLFEVPGAELQCAAEWEANHLYAQLQNLQNSKTENRPLKIIVRELKSQGY